MTSVDSDKALVPLRNHLIKITAGKLRRFFKKEIGTRSLTQLLWYVCPSHVEVVSELLYLWVLKNAASDLTSDGLNKILAAIHNKFIKNMAGKKLRFSPQKS